jgi:Zn-dependent oligopeptidase
VTALSEQLKHPHTTHQYVLALKAVLVDENDELNTVIAETPNENNLIKDLKERTDAVSWAIELVSEVTSKSHHLAESTPQVLIDEDGALVTLVDVYRLRKEVHRLRKESKKRKEQLQQLQGVS